MTATDPTTRPAHAEDNLDQAPQSDAAATFLDHAASEYNLLFERTPRMPMDVDIAAKLGLGFETRELTAAIRSLEAVISDHTATMKAFLASQQQGDLFAVEESEAAVEQLIAPEPS